MRSGGISPRRRRTLVGLTALVVLCLLAAPVAALALSVSNPPKLAGRSFSVKVKGLSGTLSVYLSPKRKLAHGDVSLGHQKPKHGKLTVKIRSTIKPGLYFVLVCKGSGRHRKCVASKKPTVVAPKISSKAPKAPGAATLVNGSATLATGSAVSGTLGAAGGSLSATGPEGTKYTLAYDANSVPNGTAVTITPLSGLLGPGLGTFDGGVELSPANVRFIRGAVLIVEPSHAVAANERGAVEFTGAGVGIHAIPTAPQKAPIVLPVGTTAGYALLSGGSSLAVASRAHAAAHGPLAHLAEASTTSGRTSFYQEELASVVHQLVEAGGDIGDGSAAAKAYEAAALSILKEWYAEIVANEVPPGMESDEAAETAENDLAAWAQTAVTMLGDGVTKVGGVVSYSETYNGMSALFGPNWEEEKVLSVDQKLDGAAYDRAQEKCANNHELGQIPTIAEWYRSDVFAGHADSLSIEELLVCEHFTVEFESTMEDKVLGEKGDGQGTYVNEYTATVHVKPQTEGTSTFPILGSTTGSYAQATGAVKKAAPCKGGPSSENESIDESGNGTTFKVVNFTPPTALGAAPTLTFETGIPTENYLVQASEAVCDPFPLVVPEPNWWDDWDDQHKSAQVADTASTYQFTLNAGGGADFGTISFDDVPFDKEDAESLENTKITVTHAPAPFTRL